MNTADTSRSDHVGSAVEDGDTKFLATLVRGEVHFLRSVRFDVGIPTVVMSHHRDHLREHAVEVISDDDGEVLVKDKFTFEPYSGPLEVGETIGISEAIRGDRDAGVAARLRAFDARETARIHRVEVEAPPAAPFDPVARRAEIEERSRKVTEEDPSLPRARPRSHAPRRA